MPQLKAQAMRDMSVEELETRIGELREELFNLHFRNSMRQLDNPLKIRHSRREMARLMTVLSEKRPAGSIPVAGPSTAKVAEAKAAKPKVAKAAAAKPKVAKAAAAKS
jgi:large subunit ribosomal protein L29